MLALSEDPRTRRLLGLVAGGFALLAIQNLAGTWINLYVTVTDPSSYAGVYPAMFASVAGATHTVIGILIGLNAILVLAFTWRLPDPRPRAVAAVLVGLAALAGYLGFHFVVSGGDNAYSFAMESTFVAILISEVALLAMTLRADRPAPGIVAAPVL